MGREVKRVPLTFDWPLRKAWDGFVMPVRFAEIPCEACCYGRTDGTGYSPHGQYLHDLWYGYVPFDPASTGSVPLQPGTPAVRRCAERNVADSPGFYGAGEEAVMREATRLARLWNSQWCHHLSQDDVDALIAAGRLMGFTHTWTRETGWQKTDPPVRLTAAQVNEWSLSGFGHDSINAGIAVKARCEREGSGAVCPACQGYGSTEAYEGQRAEADAWEPADPPAGDGWQLWETVTEGSPVSPVFATSEGLAAWMSDPGRGPDWVPPEVAADFIAAGWAPTFAGSRASGIVSGVEAVGTEPG